MISDYFEAKWQLARMRATCVGPYIDAFSTALADAGYAPFTVRGYLRAADHIGRWADERRLDIQSWDDDILMRFGRHLPRCRCIKANKGIFSNALAGVRLLLAHLRVSKVIARAPPSSITPKFAPVSEQFATWMLRHRGVAPSTYGSLPGHAQAVHHRPRRRSESVHRDVHPCLRHQATQRCGAAARRARQSRRSAPSFGTTSLRAVCIIPRGRSESSRGEAEGSDAGHGHAREAVSVPRLAQPCRGAGRKRALIARSVCVTRPNIPDFVIQHLSPAERSPRQPAHGRQRRQRE